MKLRSLIQRCGVAGVWTHCRTCPSWQLPSVTGPKGDAKTQRDPCSHPSPSLRAGCLNPRRLAKTKQARPCRHFSIVRDIEGACFLVVCLHTKRRSQIPRKKPPAGSPKRIPPSGPPASAASRCLELKRQETGDLWVCLSPKGSLETGSLLVSKGHFGRHFRGDLCPPKICDSLPIKFVVPHEPLGKLLDSLRTHGTMGQGWGSLLVHQYHFVSCSWFWSWGVAE